MLFFVVVYNVDAILQQKHVLMLLVRSSIGECTPDAHEKAARFNWNDFRIVFDNAHRTTYPFKSHPSVKRVFIKLYRQLKQDNQNSYD